jgi:hypothetical protein
VCAGNARVACTLAALSDSATQGHVNPTSLRSCSRPEPWYAAPSEDIAITMWRSASSVRCRHRIHRDVAARGPGTILVAWGHRRVNPKIASRGSSGSHAGDRKGGSPRALASGPSTLASSVQAYVASTRAHTSSPAHGSPEQYAVVQPTQPAKDDREKKKARYMQRACMHSCSEHSKSA